jgi:hypothetical protein
MTKFYRSLALASVIANIVNSTEATMREYAAAALQGQNAPGAVLGTTAVPLLPEGGLRDATVGSPAGAMQSATRPAIAISQGTVLDEAAGIATTVKRIAVHQRSDGFFTMRNDGPGIGAAAQDLVLRSAETRSHDRAHKGDRQIANIVTTGATSTVALSAAARLHGDLLSSMSATNSVASVRIRKRGSQGAGRAVEPSGASVSAAKNAMEEGVCPKCDGSGCKCDLSDITYARIAVCFGIIASICVTIDLCRISRDKDVNEVTEGDVADTELGAGNAVRDVVHQGLI